MGAQQADRPKFRAGVHVVEVDVRAFDRNGQFVGDLTRESFELLEDGVPQELSAVYLVAGSPLAAGTADPSVAAPVAAAPAGRHTWIFLFDLSHLTPGAGFDRARSAVEGFIRDRFQEGDLGGVVAGSRMVNNRLTSVREELVAAAAERQAASRRAAAGKSS